MWNCFLEVVWQVSKRNSQYFRSYLRKTTGVPLWPLPRRAGSYVTYKYIATIWFFDKRRCSRSLDRTVHRLVYCPSRHDMVNRPQRLVDWPYHKVILFLTKPQSCSTQLRYSLQPWRVFDRLLFSANGGQVSDGTGPQWHMSRIPF